MADDPNRIDLDNISNADLLHLTAANPPPASAALPDRIDLNNLTPVQAQALNGNAASPGTGPGVAQSFGRGLIEGGMLGTDAMTGVQDRAARERSRAANPWAHFAGEVTGSIAPMVAATFLPTGVGQVAAATRLGQLATRGAGLARAALVPGEMNTVGRAALQGTKLGTVYSGISGAAHADPEPTDSTATSLLQRGAGALTGAGMGAILGAPLGVAGYGASRLLGAAINRLTPSMAQVLESATGVESQGVRDVMRQLGYDNYGIPELEALQAAMRDPANRHRFANLNLYEALETQQPPQQVARAPTSNPDWEAATATLTGRPQPPPELRQPVRVSPNVRDWAQDMANTGGQGRQDAVEQFALRRQEMPGRIASDVDHFFGTGEALEPRVNQLFGSGNRAADDAAIAAQREAFNKRYERLREAPLVLTNDLVPVLRSRSMRAALENAAESDVLTNPANGGRWRWLQDPAGVPPGPGEPFILSPANILDIHHSLVMQAKPPIGGATSDSVQAGKFKNWFSDWVDTNLRGHRGLREDYAQFKQALRAREEGNNLPLNTGGPQHNSLQFLGKIDADINSAQARAQAIQSRLDRAVERVDTGARKTEPLDIVTQVRANQALQGNLRATREEFARAWGERIVQEINTATDPVGVIRKLLTGEGRARINTILGPERGAEFTRYLYGQMIKEQIASAKTPAQINSMVREHLTQRGQREIMRVLGPEDGRTFIETLMNKATQAGLSETLFGNSNTAYKLARNQKSDALMDAVHGLFHMRPMQVLGGLREIGSSVYKQRRADQGNALLSRQGPDEVLPVVDSMLARNQLRTSGHPYIMNPLSYTIGPTATTLPPLQEETQRRLRRRP